MSPPAWPVSPPSLALYLSLILLLCATASLLRALLRPGLRQLPGPRLAAVTSWWRLAQVARGDAPALFRRLHAAHGRIVRVGPNHVSIADPAAVARIYGIGSGYLKSDFYSGFDTPYDGAPMASMFSTRAPAEHKHLKTAVAAKFSMTSLRGMERLVDECSDIFLDAMRDLAGARVDLGAWLQWYAFDVIGAITFRQRFGFIEQRRDVESMIASIEAGLFYGAVVGQVPGLHGFLLGHPLSRKMLNWVPALRTAHPVAKIARVVKGAMREYDAASRATGDAPDFLAQFRAEQAKNNTRMSERDLMNHLMNNLLAGSDTTAISLRAILYYIIRSPATHQKLLAEMAAAETAGTLSEYVTLDECLKLPYLQAVMKEAMRMHPGVGFPLERVVPPPGDTLCGVALPAGAVVGVNAWVLHRDRAVFGPDADVFRAERWLEAPPEQLRVMERCFLSFGAGARSCIGKNISIMEMGKLVPRILREFEIEWAGAAADWTVKTYWFSKQSDLIVRFKQRRV